MKRFAQELRDFANLIENVEVGAYLREVNIAVPFHEDWVKLRNAVQDYPGMKFSHRGADHSCEMTTGRPWEVPVSLNVYHVYRATGPGEACLNAHMGA